MKNSVKNLPPLPVRFFGYVMVESEDSPGDYEVAIEEISEAGFCSLVSKEDVFISYERDTVRENGAAQICLTALNDPEPLDI